MYKLMHSVRAYTFDFCSFLSIAYTKLDKLLTVFLYIIFAVLLKNSWSVVGLWVHQTIFLQTIPTDTIPTDFVPIKLL